MSILSCPSEILIQIFENLDYTTFLSASVVCKRFYKISKSSCLWQNKLPVHCLGTVHADDFSIVNMNTSKDGRFLASLDTEGRIDIWKLDGNLVHVCFLKTQLQYSYNSSYIEFNTSGNKIIATSTDAKHLSVFILEGETLKFNYRTVNSKVFANFWHDDNRFFYGEGSFINRQHLSLLWLSDLSKKEKQLVLVVERKLRDVIIGRRTSANGEEWVAVFATENGIGLVSLEENLRSSSPNTDTGSKTRKLNLELNGFYALKMALTSDFRKIYLLTESPNMVEKYEIRVINVQNFAQDLFYSGEYLGNPMVICPCGNFLTTVDRCPIIFNRSNGECIKKLKYLEHLVNIIWNCTNQEYYFAGNRNGEVQIFTSKNKLIVK